MVGSFYFNNGLHNFNIEVNSNNHFNEFVCIIICIYKYMSIKNLLLAGMDPCHGIAC